MTYLFNRRHFVKNENVYCNCHLYLFLCCLNGPLKKCHSVIQYLCRSKKRESVRWWMPYGHLANRSGMAIQNIVGFKFHLQMEIVLHLASLLWVASQQCCAPMSAQLLFHVSRTCHSSWKILLLPPPHSTSPHLYPQPPTSPPPPLPPPPSPSTCSPPLSDPLRHTVKLGILLVGRSLTSRNLAERNSLGCNRSREL